MSISTIDVRCRLARSLVRSFVRWLFVPSPSHYSSLSVAHDFRLCIRTCELYLRAFIVCSFFTRVRPCSQTRGRTGVSRTYIESVGENEEEEEEKAKVEVERREGKEEPKWTSAYFASGFVYLMQNAAPRASRCRLAKISSVFNFTAPINSLWM